MFLGKVGNHFAHDVQQIMLQILQVKAVNIVGTFLNHDRAGGVMRRHAGCAVFHAGLPDDFAHFLCYIMKGGNPSPGLKFNFLLKNLEFHNITSAVIIYGEYHIILWKCRSR